MALGAVLGAALTTPAAKVWGLYVGGTDVAADYPAKRYGASIEDVELELNGPGDVSHIKFTVDDVLGQLTFTDGQEVLLIDHSRGIPGRGVVWFRGWLESYAAKAQPPTGRFWTITAVGGEILLDWYMTGYALAFAAGADLETALRSVTSSITGMGPFRGVSPLLTPFTLDAAVSIDAFTTLREAITKVLAGVVIDPASRFVFTIDGTLVLQVWNGPTAAPFGPTLVVVNTFGSGAYAGGDTQIRLDATTIYRSVVVRGTGVLVTVTDGSGRQGKTALLPDSTITTVAAAQDAGAAYLAQHLAVLSGEAGLDYTPGAGSPTEDAGQSMTLGAISVQDGTLFTGSLLFPFSSARVSFFADKPNVRLSFGQSRRSGARLIRRFTGNPLS